MKRKIIIMVLVTSTILLQTTSFAFASNQATIVGDLVDISTQVIEQARNFEMQSITNCNLSFSKSSSTRATGAIKVFSSTTPSSIKVTIRLQVADKGSTSYQNASADPVTATVSNKASLSKSFSFSISSAKKYRVKATVIETLNGNKNTYTYYRNLL